MSDHLASRRARLTPEQRAHLDRLLRGEDSDAPETPVEPDPDLPASLGQERLWLHQQLHPDETSYNEPFVLHLRGPLDPASLSRALDTLVRRHEALRTTLHLRGGALHQVVEEARSLALPVDDLTDLPAEARRAAALTRAAADLRVPFDLARGPVLRARLLRLGAHEHVLVLVLHHVACDGWSLAVLGRELALVYDASVSGERAPLAPLLLRYADHARQQRQWLAGPEARAASAAWRRRLAGAAPLELPTDWPRPTRPERPAASHTFELPADLVAALAALAHAHGTTLFTALLTSFFALLQRYTDQDDIAVGTPVAARTRAAVEPLVGFFVNMLVLRVDLAGAPSFRDLLTRVHDVTLDAQADQELSFDRLVEDLKPPRSPGRQPLFDVMFGLHSVPTLVSSFKDLDVEVLDLPRQHAKFDLSLYLVHQHNAIRGSIEYRADLFEAATIVRFAGYFSALIRAAVAAPDAPIARLSLCAAPTRRPGPPPALPCVHVQIAAQAAQAPARIAVDGPLGRLSYGELEQRATALAQRLRDLGVGPEVPVGLLVRRSPDMVVAIQAVLKAGGAYLPLDPAHPAARIQALLADARAPLLLSERALGHLCPERTPRVVFLDDPAPEPAMEPMTAPTATPEGLAYILYTSGSTGAPKGVMVTHGGLAVQIHSQRAAYAIGPTSRVLQYASLAFDASASEIFTALVSGAVLYLGSPTPLLAGPALAQVLRQGAISVVTLPPSVLATLEPEPLPALHSLIVAGEPCPARLVADWARGRRFINAYGPTETTIGATFWVGDDASRSPPIGTPLAHVTVDILDRHGDPVAPGIPGELVIGGPCVARGYLNRPDLTAERFIADPDAPTPDARRYRTGDRARARPDGAIEYLGRLDDQIKLRGIRIEPAEIEAALLSHPEVRSARVVARSDAAGGLQLVAYLVPERLPGPASAHLREHLLRRLPHALVPAAFVALAALPLTPSGKVDTRALPAPAPGADRRGQPTPPGDPIERLLVDIWTAVLGQPLGVDDNFFALGGHSLLAVQVVAEIRRSLGHDLAPASIFDHPTVAQLARRLRLDPGDRRPTQRVVLHAAEGGAPCFFIHPIGGGVGCYLDLARRLGAHRPCHGIMAPELAGLAVHPATIEAMATQCLAEVRAARPAGPYLLAGWSMGGLIALEMARQLTAAGDRVAFLALLDSRPASATLALSETARVALLLRELARQTGAAPPSWTPEPGATRDALLASALTVARAAGIVPDAVDDAFLERHLAVLRRNEEALARYLPAPYPGPIHLFVADQQRAADEPPDLGWSALCPRGVTIDTLPGDHETMLSEHVEALARRLSARLDTTDPPPTQTRMEDHAKP